MGMILKPLRNRIKADSQDLSHPKPAEEHMEVRRLRTVSVLPANELDVAEPTEEQEEIINANAHALQVPLSGAVLTERRQPTGSSLARRAFQVRIDMSGSTSGNAPLSEVRNDVGDVESSGPKIAISNPGFGMWDRQRNHLPVRKNRTRAPAGGR